MNRKQIEYREQLPVCRGNWPCAVFVAPWNKKQGDTETQSCLPGKRKPRAGLQRRAGEESGCGRERKHQRAGTRLDLFRCNVSLGIVLENQPLRSVGCRCRGESPRPGARSWVASLATRITRYLSVSARVTTRRARLGHEKPNKKEKGAGSERECWRSALGCQTALAGSWQAQKPRA